MRNIKQLIIRCRFYIAIVAINASSIFILYMIIIAYSDFLHVIWKRDGPFYVFIAKTLYIGITEENIPPKFPPKWDYAAHLIGYPLFIRLFASLLGWELSMLFVNWLFTSLGAVLFYRLIKEFNYVQNPFYITILFIFAPHQWLTYKGIGAAEPTFIFFVLFSFYLLKKEKYFFSSLAAAYASITRFEGVFLFIAYFLLIYKERKLKNFIFYLIIPFSVFLHFLLYYFAFGNFFAYFVAVERWHYTFFDHAPLGFPFEVFFHLSPEKIASEKFWINIVAIYIFYGLNIYFLYRKQRTDLMIYSIVFYLNILIIYPGEIARYALVMFTLFIGWDQILLNKYFRWFLPIYIAFCYVYAYYNIVPPAVFENPFKIR